MSHIDYLAVGHFACDITPSGTVTGGTVAYAGATAWLLGCRTAILTSYAPDFTPDIRPAAATIECVPATETTTFRNVYHNGTRTQFLHGRAHVLAAQHVPESWKSASIVHLAPIAGEIDPALISTFASSMVCITLQGWLRATQADDRVYPQYWQGARQILPLAAAVVLSAEDLAEPQWLAQFRQWAPLLVVTHGAGGCTVFMGQEERRFPAPRVQEVDPTGAGDIFAAAFFVRLFQTKGNPWEAAEFANILAARSVTAGDLPSKLLLLQNAMSDAT